jgi:hypothetical protein
MGRRWRAWLLGLVASCVSSGAIAFSLCVSAGDCPRSPLGGAPSCGKSRVLGFELPVGTCGNPAACNTGADCVPQAQCMLGACQRPPGTCVVQADCDDDERCVARRCETNAPGGGSGVPGEGRRCMPANGSRPDDWAKDKHGKPLGACPGGTRCNANGWCVRPET